jgi:hypothetical protein
VVYFSVGADVAGDFVVSPATAWTAKAFVNKNDAIAAIAASRRVVESLEVGKIIVFISLLFRGRE